LVSLTKAIISLNTAECTTEVILLAKMIELWTFYENVVRVSE